jgi:hypothetical protein
LSVSFQIHWLGVAAKYSLSKVGMDILVACHNETEDPPLFIYMPPLFDTPAPLVADYVDPHRSGRKWKDYGAESKDIIWDQYCPTMWPFHRIFDYLYHDSIFYNLFDDGWKILKPGGSIVFPFPKHFTSIYGTPIDIKSALANFKAVLKRLLARHPWTSYIVNRSSMPFIISEQYEQDKYDTYILFVKPVRIGGLRKTRKSMRRR